MVYAYDSQGALPDTRSAAELYEARERAIARWRASHTRYVTESWEARLEMESIEMEFRRRRQEAWMETPTVRFSGPLKPAPHTVRPHISETRPVEHRNGRMRLEGLDG